jgi:hypothetical protein
MYAWPEAEFDGELYVGVGNWTDGAGVWKYSGSGTGWTQVNTPGFGDSATADISAMAVYDGKLYAAARNMHTEGNIEITQAQIWAYDGNDWVQNDLGNLFDSGSDIRAMSVYDNSLYVGQDDETNGAHVLKYDGNSWTEVLDGATLGVQNIYIDSMAVFNGDLYIGTGNDREAFDGTEIWKYDGADWTEAADPGLGDSNNFRTSSMTVYDNQLYAFIFNAEGNNQIWRYDGADWEKMDTDFFGEIGMADISGAVLNGKLYVSVSAINYNDPPEIYTYDGNSWEHLDSSQLSNVWTILPLFVFDGNLYGNAQSLDSLAEVWKYTIDSSDNFNDNSSDEVQKAKITSWKAYRYTDSNKSCSDRLKLIINGKHFDKDAEVKIGGHEASSIDKKSSHELVAKFCYPKLISGDVDHKRKITVENPDADIEEADRQIDIDNISFETENNNQFDPTTAEGIKNIQQVLAKLGYLEPQYITGIYGPITTEAVRKFQADNNLPQTGFVGPLTQTELAEKI